jgi:hypothetical protein
MNDSQAKLADLIAKHGIVAKAEWDSRPVSTGTDWAPGTSHYRVSLRRADDRRQRLTVPFHMGSAHTDEPTAEDVLDCLLSDANTPEDFEEFCSEYGYDTDSRKAEKTHRACLAIGKKLRAFLGEHFETFMSAERL